MLACFTDQDARVRYYACESMYNIAKVAKGEVLPYFNDIFDALCKVKFPFRRDFAELTYNSWARTQSYPLRTEQNY